MLFQQNVGPMSSSMPLSNLLPCLCPLSALSLMHWYYQLNLFKTNVIPTKCGPDVNLYAAVKPLAVPLPPQCIFMVALVLSAKFVQDKCYSNKMWARCHPLCRCQISCWCLCPLSAFTWLHWYYQLNLFKTNVIPTKCGPDVILYAAAKF